MNLPSRPLRGHRPRFVLSTVAIACACTLQARAQTAAPPSVPAATNAPAAPTDQASGATVDSVVVTGQRASNRAAVGAKRNEERVMDAIAADESRQLPDRTLAETVRRIPGVSVTYNADNVNGRDEAQRPVIRGLDARYNNSSVDGLPLSAADATNLVTGFGNAGVRGARLDLLPSTMIKRLEVFKTWQPDQDPNSVGGNINVVTPSAFDGGGKPSLSITGALGNNSNHGVPYADDKHPRRFDLGFSRTFGADRNVGLVLAADYQKSDTATQGQMTSDNTYYTWFDAATGAAAAGNNPGNATTPVGIPQNKKFFFFQNSRERQGLSGKLEARPTASLYTFATLGRFHTEDKQQRDENFLAPGGTVSAVTPTSATFSGARNEIGVERKITERTTTLLALGTDWEIDDRQRLSARFAVSKAESTDRVLGNAKYIYSGAAPGSAGTLATFPGYAGQVGGFPPAPNTRTTLANRIDVSGFQSDVTLTGGTAAATDLGNYNHFLNRTTSFEADNLIRSYKLDYKNNMESEARGLGFGTGFEYRPTTYGFDFTQTQYVLNPAAPQAALAGLTMASAGSVSNILLPGTNGLPLLLIDLDRANAQFADNPTLFAPDAQNAKNSLQDDYDHRESTKAAYLMGSYTAATWRALAGFRYDSTDHTTSAWQKIAANTVPAYVAPDQLVTVKGKDSFVLPAASLNVDVAPDVKLRAAVSKTIGRPDYAFYAPRISVLESLTLDAAGRTIITVNVGNPDIKPRESTNLDLSSEWYGRDVMLSAAVFYKDIKNEIFAPTTRSTFGFGTETRTADITQPINAPGASMRGIELGAVVDSLRGLSPGFSGLGFSTNLTFIDASMKIPQNNGSTREINRIFGQPDTLANFTGFYTVGGLSLRASYNRTGRSLRALDTQNPWQDVYWKAREQVDLSARYKFESEWALFAEVKNATRSAVTSVTGPNKSLLKDTYATSRTIWVGVTYTPKLAD